jgi:prepilin peptidase CpaA
VPTLKQVLFGVLVVTATTAVVTDLKLRKIHDLLTYPAMALCLGLRLWFEGVGDLEKGLLSGLAGLAATVLWFGGFAIAKKGMGWGDVKLAGVMGAAFGMPLTLAAMLFVSVVGAFQAVVSLIWAGALSDTVRGVLARKADGQSANPVKRNIPYGVAIALGSFWAMWWD